MTHQTRNTGSHLPRWLMEVSAAILVGMPLLVGCAEDARVSTPPTLTAKAAKQMEQAKTAEETPTRVTGDRQTFDGLEFVVPSKWKKVELSQMQMGIITARFQMSDEAPGVTLTLSRSGGGVDANMNRWKGQFSDKSREDIGTITVAGVKSRQIDQEGRFAGGFGKPAADGWRMIGVIVPLADQGYFIKLTGPAAEVEAVEDDFRTFVKSAARG